MASTNEPNDRLWVNVLVIFILAFSFSIKGSSRSLPKRRSKHSRNAHFTEHDYMPEGGGSILAQQTTTAELKVAESAWSVYAINMVGSAGKLRRDLLLEAFRLENTPLVLWPAVMPELAEVEAWSAVGKAWAQRNAKFRYQKRNGFPWQRYMAPSVKALARGHHGLFHYLLENTTASWIVVAEDDIILKSGFAELLNAALRQADPTKTDVLRLSTGNDRGPRSRHSKSCDPKTLKVVKGLRGLNGAFLYAISRAGAAQQIAMVPTKTRGWLPQDDAISSSWVRKYDVNCWLASHNYSTILSQQGGRHESE